MPPQPHPHGPGFVGGMHSHDTQFPDDAWNLYSMLEAEGTTALNVTRPDHAIGIFKPHVHRLDEFPQLISDADQEIIVTARFTSPVHIRRLMVIGGGDPSQYPASLKCYVNRDDLDFTNVDTFNCTQEFVLAVDAEGWREYSTTLQNFSNALSITFYFPTNYGGENTVLRYLGLQGEHTHYRREAVNTTYEVLCNGQDIEQPESVTGEHSHHMH